LLIYFENHTYIYRVLLGQLVQMLNRVSFGTRLTYENVDTVK